MPISPYNSAGHALRRKLRRNGPPVSTQMIDTAHTLLGLGLAPEIVDDEMQLDSNGVNSSGERVPMLSADVEFFLISQQDGAFVPATGLTKGGNKGNPVWLDKYTGILEDNAALEINMPPSKNGMDFSRVVGKAQLSLNNWTEARNLRLKMGNCQTVSLETMANNPALSEFGCSEDYVAYGLAPTFPRKPIRAKQLGDKRFAAGHLHFSYDTSDLPPYIFARWLDATIGLDSVFWDKQKERRQFYGLAGLFRPTEYPDGSTGVEYRTLSNLWFFDRYVTERLGETVFYLLKLLRKDMDTAKKEYAKIPWTDVQTAINEADTKEATSIQAYLSSNSSIIEECRDNSLGSSKGRSLHFAIEA